MGKKNKFCHIPKTGGVSVLHALNLPIVGHEILLKDDFDFLYTFVRNPYDRAVSAYSYLKNGGMGNINDINAKNKYIKNLSFNDFVKTQLPIAVNEQEHFIPQHKWFPSGAHFIGYFENIGEDFKKICDLMNIGNVTLPKKNTSNHDFYRDYYNDELYNIIYDLYTEDFKLFNYKK